MRFPCLSFSRPLQPSPVSPQAHPSRPRELPGALSPPRLSTPSRRLAIWCMPSPDQTPSGLYTAPSGPSAVLFLCRRSCCGSPHIQQQQSRRLTQALAVATDVALAATVVTRPRCRRGIPEKHPGRNLDTRRVARVCIMSQGGWRTGLIQSAHAPGLINGCGFLPMELRLATHHRAAANCRPLRRPARAILRRGRPDSAATIAWLDRHRAFVDVSACEGCCTTFRTSEHRSPDHHRSLNLAVI